MCGLKNLRFQPAKLVPHLQKLAQVSDLVVALILMLIFVPEFTRTAFRILSWPPSGKRFDAAYEETLKALR